MLDSGATHHLTVDVRKAGDMQPFIGSEGVTIGNGPKLPIHNVGTKTILSFDHQLLLEHFACTSGFSKFSFCS